jgi:hypothetical protein
MYLILQKPKRRARPNSSGLSGPYEGKLLLTLANQKPMSCHKVGTKLPYL